MQRERNQCFIQVEAAVVDRLRTMRKPCESYSDVILRLIELRRARLNGALAHEAPPPRLLERRLGNFLFGELWDRRFGLVGHRVCPLRSCGHLFA